MGGCAAPPRDDTAAASALVARLAAQADARDEAIVREDRAAIEASMADDFRQLDGAGNVGPSERIGSSARETGGAVPKKGEKARAQGFKRGLRGKRDAAGLTQGWTDDEASSVARSEGWVAGKRKRAQLEAQKARAKK